MKPCRVCLGENADDAFVCRHCGRDLDPLRQPPSQAVRIVDVDIPFGSLLGLFLKVSIAAIPAALILAFIAMIVVAFAAAFFRGLA